MARDSSIFLSHDRPWLAAIILAFPLVLGACGSPESGFDASSSRWFGDAIVTPLGGRPSSLAFGDFNGDGRIDVAFTMGGAAYVALGNGDGSFQSARALASPPSSGALAAADFDRDGRLDLALIGCGQPSCALSDRLPFVMLGNGNGSFRVPVPPAAGSGALSLAVSDFNGDGSPDLAVGYTNASSVSVLLGNGDGTFRAPTDWPATLFGAPSGAAAVAAADFNGDGKRDLAIFGIGMQAGFAVLLGYGDGTFGPPLFETTSEWPTQQAIADFNGDNWSDVAFNGSRVGMQPGPGRITILPGKGDGTFGAAAYPAYPWEYYGATFDAGDVDRDGRPDLVVRPSDTSDLSILLGRGDGSFADAQTDPLALESAGSEKLVDVNGDGRLDLVLLTATGLAVLPGSR